MAEGTTASFIRPAEFWRELGLRADQTVVHLGCGPGFYLIPAAIIVGKKGRAIGIDILTHMLAETEARARRAGVADWVQTKRADLEGSMGSGLEAGMAHWVLVANILHQAKPAAILAEAVRLVRTDGAVAIVEWDTAATPFGPPVEARVSSVDAIAAAETVGLTVARQWRPSPYHYGLVLRHG